MRYGSRRVRGPALGVWTQEEEAEFYRRYYEREIFALLRSVAAMRGSQANSPRP